MFVERRERVKGQDALVFRDPDSSTVLVYVARGYTIGSNGRAFGSRDHVEAEDLDKHSPRYNPVLGKKELIPRPFRAGVYCLHAPHRWRSDRRASESNGATAP